jgi:mannose-6-phosphate isomerase-like protein (cupin superfamily)
MMTNVRLAKNWCGAVTLLAALPAAGTDWIGPAGEEKAVTARNIETLLHEQPLAPGENIKPIALVRNARTSHVLVQIRDREPVHYHADSDISVVIVRGSGIIHIAQQQLPAKAGDVMFVPRGVVHYFVNDSKEPAAALVIYSPPPGPKDRVLVESAPN